MSVSTLPKFDLNPEKLATGGRGSDFIIGFGGSKQLRLGREGRVEGLMPNLETKTMLRDALPASLR